MKQVTLKPLLHHEQECIGIYFNHNSAINETIRKNAKAKWSQTNKCWYVALSKESYSKLKIALAGKAKLDNNALRNYLETRKTTLPASNIAVISKANLQSAVKKLKSNPASTLTYIGPVNKYVLPAMEQHLKLKAYSPSTIRTYLNEMTQLLGMLKGIPADELTPEHLKRYLVYCYEKLGLKENTLHS